MEDKHEFIAGGYLLTRPTKTPEYLASDGLLPDKLLSAGTCIAGTPGIFKWAGGNPERLGVPNNKLEALEEWDKHAFGKVIGFPDVFYDLAAAQKFVEEFIPEPSNDLVILCPALPIQFVEQFLISEKRNPERGIYETLERRTAPASGGTVLGYEPLCYFYDLDHTWLCNDLHKETVKRWNVKPNALGFLDDFDDAQKISSIAFDIGAEDGLWLPWLIIKYPPVIA